MVLAAVFSSIPFSLQIPCTIAFPLILIKCLASYFPEKNNSFKREPPSTCWIFNNKLTFPGLCPFLLAFCFHGSIFPNPVQSLFLHRALDVAFSYLPSRHLAPSGPLCPVSLTSLLWLSSSICQVCFVLNKQIILIWIHILFIPLSFITRVYFLPLFSFFMPQPSVIFILFSPVSLGLK